MKAAAKKSTAKSLVERLTGTTVEIDPKFNRTAWKRSAIEGSDYELVSVTVDASGENRGKVKNMTLGNRVVAVQLTKRDRFRSVVWQGKDWNKASVDFKRLLSGFSTTVKYIRLNEKKSNIDILLKGSGHVHKKMVVYKVNDRPAHTYKLSYLMKLMGDLYYDGCVLTFSEKKASAYVCDKASI